jgi:hypothetical protein
MRAKTETDNPVRYCSHCFPFISRPSLVTSKPVRLLVERIALRKNGN